MKMRKIAIVFGAILLGQSLVMAELLPTRLRVRVISRDAKVVGTGVGGAMVTVRSLESGEILARGMQLGGTGNTDKIMVQPRERFATIFDIEGTAHFETTLMLDRPTPVEVAAEGPLGYPQSIQRSSKTILLVPGKDVLGEGLLLELNGFIVQILSPEEGRHLPPASTVSIRTRMAMT